jgi:hypothetical protein
MSFLDDLENIDEKAHTNPNCKGKVYRCRVESFLDSQDNIVVRKSLRLLKRESCPDCETCGWINEFIAEDIDQETDYIGNLENGKKYRVEGHWYPGPYEYPDEGDLEIEFVEIKEGI